MKKTRRPRKKNNYFTKVHEQAIIDYALTNDIKIRTELYIQFIHKVKQNSKKLKRDLQYENLNNETELEEFIVENTYEQDREKKEFWEHLFSEMDKWEKMKLRESEKKVLDAIKILFNSTQDIEIFNKKAIYLYMREITGLNTKQIVNKVEWEKGNI